MIVDQTAHLASFMAGCYTNDRERVFSACKDVLIEPHRAQLIPGFETARDAAYAAGARAFSISGSGPTVFALTDFAAADRIREAMENAFQSEGVGVDVFISKVGCPGAHVVEVP